MGGLTSGLLHRMLAPRAVTVVGASPDGHITDHLLRNLGNPSCAFAGPVHLVNPRRKEVFGRPCLPSTAEVPGEPGLVYLLVRGEACLPALAGLPSRPAGVVLFPDASRQPGGYEEDVAAWGRENQVAVLGPQSNGLVSTEAGLLGLLIPVVDQVAAGGVAVLAQSGGVLGGIVKFLAQRQVGLHAALEYGTAAMLSPWTLGAWLLERPEVRLLALYADGVDSVEQFAGLLAAARAADRAVVAMVAGGSAAAQRAAASHSGVAATPRRVIEGVAAQHGAILAGTLDELAWSIEAIAAVGFRRPGGPHVALFSDSGGGVIAATEALAAGGLGLPQPEPPAAANPFDFGSASMGEVAAQGEVVRAAAQDPRFGIFAFASTIGRALRERSVHAVQLRAFAETVAGFGGVPFIASPLPFLPEAGLPPAGAVFGNGSTESAAKLKALSIWAGAGAPARPSSPSPLPAAGSPTVISGEPAQRLLASLPLDWPHQVTVSRLDELDGPLPDYPVVAKTEAGLAHRARVGGVLAGLDGDNALRSGVAYLLERFGGPVSISRQVEHDVEYFLGAQRSEGSLLILLGAGGAAAESAGARLAPLDAEQAQAFAGEWGADHATLLRELLLNFQEWLLATPWVEAVDLNPLVPAAGRLVALDAKIHR